MVIGADRTIRPRPTGDGITVAIIDTGIDDSHPDLQGKVRDRYQPGPGPLAITNDHGTHVAGIVAAEPNNDEGIVGIAPGVELLDAPALAAASAPSVSDSVRWATDSGADVVNMSIALVITMKRSLWDKITFTQSVGSLTETFELALYYASSNGVILCWFGWELRRRQRQGLRRHQRSTSDASAAPGCHHGRSNRP